MGDQERKDVLTERMRQIRDKVDNYLMAARMPLPPALHIEGLSNGLREIAALATTEPEEAP